MYAIDIPADVNTLTLTASGEPTVDVDMALEDGAGRTIPLTPLPGAADRLIFTAPVEAGGRYLVRVLPGAEPRTMRRQVFDLIGPAARASGDLSGFTMSEEKSLSRSMAMMGESEIQVLASRIAPEFLTHLAAQNALGNRPVLDELARDPFGKIPANYMELFSKLSGMPAALYTLASLRFDLNPFGDWVYVDRPTVVAAAPADASRPRSARAAAHAHDDGPRSARAAAYADDGASAEPSDGCRAALCRREESRRAEPHSSTATGVAAAQA